MDTTAGMAARATWPRAECSWRTEPCCPSTQSRPLPACRALQAGVPRVHPSVASATPLHHLPPIIVPPPAQPASEKLGRGEREGKRGRRQGWGTLLLLGDDAVDLRPVLVGDALARGRRLLRRAVDGVPGLVEG